MRVADLSRSAAFRRVLERVERGDPPRAVLLSALAAAKPILRRAHEDPVVVAAFAVAMDPPQPRRAARSRMSLVASAAESLDAHADALGRSDLGELAQLAVLDALLAGEERVVRHALGRFLARVVSVLLARVLPEYVGEGRRFATVADHARFVDELDSAARALADDVPIEVASTPADFVRGVLAALPEEAS